MPAPGSGSGPAARPTEDDVKPGSAAKLLAPGTSLPFVPPRVTLTIEFGSLTPDSIKAIGTFVQQALATSPATALGYASTVARGEEPAAESASAPAATPGSEPTKSA